MLHLLLFFLLLQSSSSEKCSSAPCANPTAEALQPPKGRSWPIGFCPNSGFQEYTYLVGNLEIEPEHESALKSVRDFKTLISAGAQHGSAKKRVSVVSLAKEPSIRRPKCCPFFG